MKLRHAVQGDVPALVDLLEELDQFYGVTEFPPLKERERQVAALLFGPMPAARVLLAEDNGHVVGLASYSRLWPAAGVTASLYLKELYVRRSHRRQGLGRQLMREICSIAYDSGCSRVEWTTDRDNTEAQAFYRRLGVLAATTKVMYRLDCAGFRP
ncbi:GNAT family N-acetyltransferase [Micromonospora echinofusca]|uniref:GNAT family N-acetyltransferase n=1 Tax=Micromonospora echinofusca TaxID=47858 RepID=A0ABS3VM46_MICEH|nr:GNAT family N-acetyltransferase [Micromonospora echinofusca]MBO4205587.1 GNAT family N-acetyltransferase [Micromonospora echinofusca]